MVANLTALNACMSRGGTTSSDKLFREKELKKAFKHLKKAGLENFKLTLTEDQLRQIDEARARGDEISLTISLS